MGLTYLYPNGAKAPTQAQMERKYSSVHVIVDFAADPALPTPPVAPVDVVHNFQFDLELPPENLQVPIVIVNPIGGGPGSPPHSIAVKDGNTITIGKLGTGGVTLDVWIFRHPVHTGIFGL
jgi:hypothetical protein